MANSVSNVVNAKPLVTGGVLVAPVGSTLPTDEAAALNAAFKAVGYATDDGVTRGDKIDSDTKYAWGGDTLAVLFKSRTFTAKLGLAEYLNPVTQQVIYGTSAVSVTAATSSAGAKMAIAGSAVPPPHNAWAIEIVSGVAKVRIIFPDAQITDLDDVSYKDDDISARGITLTLFPDSSGNYFYEYTNDGVKTGS
jgi:hypothetical protein